MKKVFLLFILSLFISTSAFAAVSIHGTVSFEGKVPKPKRLQMEADSICLAINKNTTIYAETFVLGENNTLGNVFVSIDKVNNKKLYPLPTEPAVLDQKGCNYSPHILVLRVGQKFKILNPDGTLHNVNAKSKVNPEYNLAMPNTVTQLEKVYLKPEGMFPVRCDVHPWMMAWIAVMEHPFYDVTKKDGHFKIEDLPEGEYDLVFWHERLGAKKQHIKVVDGQDQEINITFTTPT